MSRLRKVLGWLGIILLGLFNGILEDLVFLNVLVPYMPTSLDLTGDLFWTFTVPLAQLLTLAVTGTLAWFFLSLRQLPRLVTYWACWTGARTFFLNTFNNPAEDILIYVLWIALWCILIGLLDRFTGTARLSGNQS
ncbi:MAG: hypothetical protein AAGG11_09780 [Pseudomonadota bacterium]